MRLAEARSIELVNEIVHNTPSEVQPQDFVAWSEAAKSAKLVPVEINSHDCVVSSVVSDVSCSLSVSPNPRLVRCLPKNASPALRER